MPRSALMCATNSRIRCLATTSRPTVGSSRYSRSGAGTASRRRGHRASAGRARAAAPGRRGTRSMLEQLDQLGLPIDHRRRPARRRGRGQRGTTRAAAGPTTAGCAGRRRRRCVARVRLALPRRIEAGDRDRAGGRREDAGQHLDRRRLARSVGAEVADQLARSRCRTRCRSTARITSWSRPRKVRIALNRPGTRLTRRNSLTRPSTLTSGPSADATASQCQTDSRTATDLSRVASQGRRGSFPEPVEGRPGSSKITTGSARSPLPFDRLRNEPRTSARSRGRMRPGAAARRRTCGRCGTG